MDAGADGAGRWPEGVGRVVLREVDSTMAEAARRAPDLAAPTWILAGRQIAARGRRGRVWRSPEGNFAATLVMRLDCPAPQAALRSFTAALALREACVAATRAAGRDGADRFTLKWPNDVLLDGGKLAGILLERVGAVLLVGIGVNLAAAPAPDAVEAGALPPVALADATGVALAPAAFLDLLAPAFAAWEARLAGEGFASVRAAWLARAAGLGAVAIARTGTEEITGRFETVDADGHLVLATAQGSRVVAAAEVFF